MEDDKENVNITLKLITINNNLISSYSLIYRVNLLIKFILNIYIYINLAHISKTIFNFTKQKKVV